MSELKKLKVNGKKLLSDFKFYSGNYSKFLADTQKYETWEESVERIMNMHRLKYADKAEILEPYFKEIQEAYNEKLILGSQRALQFAFAQENVGILKHNSKLYNCLTSYADRPAFFQEAMYWLLSGCGVGFRVFQKDVNNYDRINVRNKGVKVHVIEDSIEGWSDAIGILISSFLAPDTKGITFPEYSGYIVYFDYSAIRPKGALITGGFKAPGPDGLRSSIAKIENILNERSFKADLLRTIDVYDIVMHMSDAVLSGGVRRSATICLFEKTDKLMLNAKTGDWYITNPQRARSNNSVLLLKNETTKEEFDELFKSIKDWGEPGFVWTHSYDVIFNPCVEIGMYPQTVKGVSGWQGCNLTEGNGAQCDTKEKFFRMCRASALMGTLQAGYTDFAYVDKTSPAKEIFEREALLGCSITGFANNPDILFDRETLLEGAEILKKTNLELATLLGINPAARLGCVKPSGNASVLLMTGSGVHGEHSKRFFRIVQVNKEEDLVNLIIQSNPIMVEESVWSANKTDYVVYFPVENDDKCLFKKDLLGIDLLEKVKLVQQTWVEGSTNVDRCVYPLTRHNVSNTINVIDWDETRDYIYENREWFAGISLLSNSGDKDYTQAPFTSVLTAEEILEKYGVSSMFASGLIVDGLHAFNNDLWSAINTILFAGGVKENILPTTSENALKNDWIRRFFKFSNKYFNGDDKTTSYLLKDVYLLHKWEAVVSNLKEIDWANSGVKPKYTDIDTTSGLACSGGVCEIVF